MTLIAIFALTAVPQDDAFNVGRQEVVKDARVRKVTLVKSPREVSYSTRLNLLFVEGAILVCEPRGYVRRLSLPGLKVEAEARLPASVVAFGLSRAGLLALSSTNDDLRILDPGRLELKKTIETKGGMALATSPALDIAFIQGRGGLITVNLDSGQEVRRHDAGKIIEEFKRRIKRPAGDTNSIVFGNFPNLTCSSDGRYFFSGSGTGVLYRFAISGPDLLPEELAPLAHTHGDFSVSSDGRFVAVAGLGRSPSYVLSASDMATKEAVIPEEYRLSSVIVDAAMERVIALEEDRGTVSTFSMRGEKTASYPVSPAFGCKRIFASPSGKAVAVSFEIGFYWLEWP